MRLFKEKLTAKRYVQNEKNSLALRVDQAFESDRGRIINSAAVRRLQQKTQVFPLERNLFVRTRLTHSLEVQQVGRYIVKEIVNRLQKEQQYNTDLPTVAPHIETLVEMACLLHDIGNPPFGHFGENAINKWFSHYLSQKMHPLLPKLLDSPELQKQKQAMITDLCSFDGNAQAIRLVHTLLKLNLTYPQIASILKYTRPAFIPRQEAMTTSPQHNYLLSKPGYYLSEAPFISLLCKELALENACRYPLTYIMEAADDISYGIADLEDAVEKRLFSIDKLYELLQEEWKNTLDESGSLANHAIFEQIIESSYLAHKEIPNDNYVDKEDYFFTKLRVNSITYLVACAADSFVNNASAILAGTFNATLFGETLNQNNPPATDALNLLNTFKHVSMKHVFTHESVEELELQGDRIIKGLFDIYSILLALSYDDFNDLFNNNGLKHYAIETRLFHKLPRKYCLAYQEACATLAQHTQEEKICLEFYYRCRLLQDYISGMTDHFAHDEYRRLMVAD